MQLVLPATAQSPAAPASLNQPVPVATSPGVALTPPTDVAQLPGLYFGALARTTFVIPPGSLVVTVPGMFGPKASVEPLAAFMRQKGHDAKAVLVPGIGTAQKMRDSTDWLISRIDNLRTERAQDNLRSLMRRLKGLDTKAQKALLREEFGLDRSRQATAVVDALHALLLADGSKFVQKVLSLDPHVFFTHKLPKSDYQRLSLILKQAIGEMADAAAPAFYGDEQAIGRRNETLIKTLNRVMDRLAPRAVLVGHSLGGVISTKSMLDEMDDVGLVISLGSPLNGTEAVPPSFEFLQRYVPAPLQEAFLKTVRTVLSFLFPAIEQMNAPSQSVRQLQESPYPFDTTAISVANPMDGLVTPRNAQHNEQKPGRLNLTVTPLESSMDNLLHPIQQYLLKWLNLNPAYVISRKLLEHTQFYKGISHHCGLVEHFDHYWPSEGDMMKAVFDDEAQAVPRLRRLLNPQNNEAVRMRVLDLMIDRVTEDPDKAALYQPLISDLRAIAQESLPFVESSAKKAKALLRLLKAPAVQTFVKAEAVRA